MFTGAYAILKRNFNILVNSKLSSIAIFLGPIFLMVVVGIVLQNSQLRSINVGIYNSNWSAMDGDQFVTGFQQKIGTSVLEYSLDSCKSAVVNGIFNACIEIEKGEYNPLKDKGVDASNLNVPSYQVMSYVDFSKTQTVWGVINRIQTVTNLQSQETAKIGIADAVSKIDDIISQIQTQRDNLNEIEYGLSVVENNLQNVENNANLIKSELSTESTNIQTILNNLDSLNKFAGITLEMTNQITGIESELINLNLQASHLSSSTSSIIDDATSLNGEVETLRNQITLVSSSMDQIITEWNTLKNTDLFQISQPISSNYQSVLDNSKISSSQPLQSLDYLFPSFLMFFIIFVSLVFPATFIIRERMSKAYIRNATSKVKGKTFAVFNFLSCFLIISVQIFAIIVLSRFFLNVDILNNIYPTVIIVMVAISTLSLLGMIIGYLFDNHENAIITAISLSLMFLIFLPGITPSETLPSPFSYVLKYLPPTIFEDKLRMSTLFGTGLSFSILEIIAILATTAFSILLITLLYRKNKRKEI